MTTSAAASFTQPLINGFGRNSQAIEDMTLAQRNMIYAVRT